MLNFTKVTIPFSAHTLCLFIPDKIQYKIIFIKNDFGDPAQTFKMQTCVGKQQYKKRKEKVRTRSIIIERQNN